LQSLPLFRSLALSLSLALYLRAPEFLFLMFNPTSMFSCEENRMHAVAWMHAYNCYSALSPLRGAEGAIEE
jgi:hypothetical protein